MLFTNCLNNKKLIMSNCLDVFNYSGRVFEFDVCANVIAYTVEQEQFSKFTKESLTELSKVCFDAYKYRLEDISGEIFDIGREEYDLINSELISRILYFNPLSFSFSITEDPSLHFFVRFSGDISLFVEIYLDIEDGNDTYIQILKTNRPPLLEKNCSFDEAVENIDEILSSSILESSKDIFLLKPTKKTCKASPKDLSLMRIR